MGPRLLSIAGLNISDGGNLRWDRVEKIDFPTSHRSTTPRVLPGSTPSTDDDADDFILPPTYDDDERKSRKRKRCETEPASNTCCLPQVQPRFDGGAAGTETSQHMKQFTVS